MGRYAVKIVLLVIGLLFLTAGALTWNQTRKEEAYASQAAKWPKHPAKIISSGVIEFTDGERRRVRTSKGWEEVTKAYPRIVFSYEVGGRFFTNETMKPNFFIGTGHDDATALVRQYPVGANAEVRVNPSKPEEAELEGANRAAGVKGGKILSMFLGVIGGVMLLNGVLKRQARGRFFFLFFGLLWIGFGWSYFLDAGKESAQAKRIAKWPLQPATILKSEIVEVDGVGRRASRRRAYPRIVYNYEVNGTTWTNEIARPLLYWNRGYAQASAMVQKYPTGSNARAHVNPQRPYESELEGNNRLKDAGWLKFWSVIAIFIGMLLFLTGVAGTRFWRRAISSMR